MSLLPAQFLSGTETKLKACNFSLLAQTWFIVKRQGKQQKQWSVSLIIMGMEMYSWSPFKVCKKNPCSDFGQ